MKQQRPSGLIGLTLHAVKLKWEGLDRTRRLALAGVVLAFALALGAFGQCLLGSGSCPASGGCPSSADAPASPCAR